MRRAEPPRQPARAIQVLSPGTNTWTSARLKTQGLQTFNSGRIEAKLQIPSHAGLWSAFWMLGSQPGVSWPTVGESDIMENWPATSNIQGPDAYANCSTIHTQVTAGNGKGGCFPIPNGGLINDPAGHIYGQIWSANMIQYYIDDPTQPLFVVTASDLPAGDTWPFSSPANPFFIIMNIAVGGTLGAPTDSSTGSQAPMLVDYVRHYVPSAVSPPQLTPNGNITISAGATSGNTTTIDMLGTIGSGRVTFTCTTTAPQASCVVTSNDPLNPHTVDFTNSGAASPTVTVTTTYYATAAGISGMTRFGLAWGIVLALVFSGLMRNGREIRRGVGLAGVALAIAMLPACGGGYNNKTTPPNRTGTPSGNYQVTVNAFTVSSTDASVPSASTSFNLTVN